jgi:hypothetical protein
VLAKEASGLRHLRWAREILGSLEAHHEHDPRLSQAQRDIVLGESVRLRAEVNALSAAVKAYRDFLERERTRFRGMLRVASYLGATARGEDQRAEAEAIRTGFDDAFAALESRERLPRKLAVRASVGELRAAVEAMDRRLRAALPPLLVDGIYPELAADGARVAGDGDEDDDATG